MRTFVALAVLILSSCQSLDFFAGERRPTLRVVQVSRDRALVLWSGYRESDLVRLSVKQKGGTPEPHILVGAHGELDLEDLLPGDYSFELYLKDGDGKFSPSADASVDLPIGFIAEAFAFVGSKSLGLDQPDVMSPLGGSDAPLEVPVAVTFPRRWQLESGLDSVERARREDLQEIAMSCMRRFFGNDVALVGEDDLKVLAEAIEALGDKTLPATRAKSLVVVDLRAGSDLGENTQLCLRIHDLLCGRAVQEKAWSRRPVVFEGYVALPNYAWDGNVTGRKLVENNVDDLVGGLKHLLDTLSKDPIARHYFGGILNEPNRAVEEHLRLGQTKGIAEDDFNSFLFAAPQASAVSAGAPKNPAQGDIQGLGGGGQ